MAIPKEWKNKIIEGSGWKPEFVISSGSFALDFSPALEAYNGIPAGTMVQISSDDEGSFKTTMALEGAKQIQEQLDGKIAFIDAEAGLTGLDWVESMGVLTDADHWTYAQPESGEEAFAMAKYFIESDEYKGIIIDSIDACVPQKQLDSEPGDADIGLHAKLVTREIRKFKTLVRTHQTILWLVNQKKVHLTHMGAMGTKSTGGRAINFYCKLNLDMRKDGSQNKLKGEDVIPLTINVRRSKLGLSYKDVTTYARQGYGIDKYAELAEIAKDRGLLVQSGSWWKTKEGETLGQGITSATSWCKLNEEEVLKLLKDDIHGKEKEVTAEAEDENGDN